MRRDLASNQFPVFYYGGLESTKIGSHKMNPPQLEEDNVQIRSLLV